MALITLIEYSSGFNLDYTFPPEFTSMAILNYVSDRYHPALKLMDMNDIDGLLGIELQGLICHVLNTLEIMGVKPYRELISADWYYTPEITPVTRIQHYCNMLAIMRTDLMLRRDWFVQHDIRHIDRHPRPIFIPSYITTYYNYYRSNGEFKVKRVNTYYKAMKAHLHYLNRGDIIQAQNWFKTALLMRDAPPWFIYKSVDNITVDDIKVVHTPVETEEDYTLPPPLMTWDEEI